MKNNIIALLFTIFILSSDYLIGKEFSLFGAGLFLVFVLFITLFFKPYRVIYWLLFVLGSIHHLFFGYFHRSIISTDIYLFFTHIGETFESFYALPSLFVSPFVLILSGLFFLWRLNKIEMKRYPLKRWIKYPVLLLLIVVNLNSTMGLQLVEAMLDLSFQKPKTDHPKESPLYPKRENNINIVLLIGESMKFNEYVEAKLKAQNFFYKKIYSGATNTDVAVPLLLNAKTNPLKLSNSNETNLFRLANKNHFVTSFISMQSEKSLQYIKPYLQTKYINTYKSYNKEERKSKFDFLLLDSLNSIDFSKNNFMVLQQIGQHSPYYYFEGDVSDNPTANYNRSIDYSFELYDKIYNLLKVSKKPFIFIYASDHGEFSGEDGRYGHNLFDSLIYTVPMFIASNTKLPDSYKDIKSHYHISQLLIYLLGYKEKLALTKAKSIVNGTMLSREDGFMVVP